VATNRRLARIFLPTIRRLSPFHHAQPAQTLARATP
jgi:hypothetical protein